MLKKSKIGDSVAYDMEQILGDSDFQSIFGPPELTKEYSEALASAPQQAFVRVASVKTDDPEQKALAVQYLVEQITQASAALDNMGFEKSSTVALALANGILKEAQDSSFLPGMKGRIEELGETPLNLMDVGEEEEVETTDVTESDELNAKIDEASAALESGNAVEARKIWVDAWELLQGISDSLGDTADQYMKDLMELSDKIDAAAPELNNATAAFKASLNKLAKDKKEDKKKKKEDKGGDVKKCVDFAKKCMKKNKVNGTVEEVKGACEVACEGDKKACDECIKSIKEFCKEQKITCKCTKKVVKKEAVIRDPEILKAIAEIDSWLEK